MTSCTSLTTLACVCLCFCLSLCVLFVCVVFDTPPPTPTPSQLLTDLAHSPDSKQRDDSAYLINCLINDAPQLIMPYVSPILKVCLGCEGFAGGWGLEAPLPSGGRGFREGM